MASTNSTEVANHVTQPPTFSEHGRAGGHVVQYKGNFEVAAADFDADGDTAVLALVDWNFRPSSIRLAGDDLDGSTNVAFNVGIYRWDEVARSLGAEVDEDFFGSAVSFQSALRLTEVIDEAAAAANVTNVGKTMWELAGLTAVPTGKCAIVLTQSAASASAAAGTIAYEITGTAG